MNNTCRYRLKCQPEYCYPFHYLCAPYANPHAGPGVCWGLFYPRKDCETTWLFRPFFQDRGVTAYWYPEREDAEYQYSIDWEADLPGVIKRWGLCQEHDLRWVRQQEGSDEDPEPWSFDWLAYPTPGP